MVVNDRGNIVKIPVDEIRPNPSQPRKCFSSRELEELALSIYKNGLLQPITVRKVGEYFELVSGERRLRATKLAGIPFISAIVISCDDAQSAVYALIENIQRKDLKLFEEAEGLKKLIDEWGITQEEAAHRLGKSQSSVANKLRLLKLTPAQREKISESGLTERHARALLRVIDAEDREKLLNEVIKKEYNVSQTDKLVEKYLLEKEDTGENEKGKKTFVARDIRIFINTIDHAVKAMKLAGIQSEVKREETEAYIDCTVRIYKRNQSESA